MTFDNVDVDNLALVTWKEARGEGVEGCRAVMHVIANRVGAKDFPSTLHNVIYQKLFDVSQIHVSPVLR